MADPNPNLPEINRDPNAPVKPFVPTVTDPPRVPDTRSDLAKAEDEVYGVDAPRAPDGTILEKGSGSIHQRLGRDKRVHLASLAVRAAGDDVITLVKQLQVATDRLAAAQKDMADAAATPVV